MRSSSSGLLVHRHLHRSSRLPGGRKRQLWQMFAGGCHSSASIPVPKSVPVRHGTDVPDEQRWHVHVWTATEGPRQGRLRLGEPHVEAQRAMSPPCASPTSPRLEIAHAAYELALAPRANRHGVQHVVRDGAICKRIQFVSHTLETIDAKCPAAIVTNSVDGPLARRSIAVRQPRHLALAVRLAMATPCPHASEGTGPTMAHSRPLRPLRSHCEQTQRRLLGSGER